MKLTVSEGYYDQIPARRDERTYQVNAVTIEPYDEGTTDKSDHPCLTLSFGNKAEAEKFYEKEKSLIPDEYWDSTGCTYFIHFWHVPKWTNISVKAE